MERGKFDLAIAIALVPILGTGLVLINQLGRLMFYGVPFELLELDAYKILISSLSMLFMGTAVCYVGATFYDPRESPLPVRLLFHLIFAAAVTSPFWLSDLDFDRPISWPGVILVVLTGMIIFGIDYWLKREKEANPKERLSNWLLTTFFGSLLVLGIATTHGYLAERDRVSFPFLGDSDEAVVGKVGDLLIVETYDRERRTFDTDRTKLVSSEGATLVTRTIE